MTESELITLVQREIKGLTGSLVTDDYGDAVDEAERETSFTLPTSADFQIRWLKQRVKRHLFFALLSGAATSFKVKQLNLQQKFEHFHKLVELMDKDFEKALKEEAYEFAQVEAKQVFGHKVDAGFAYEDDTGRDITYDPDQLIPITPSDND